MAAEGAAPAGTPAEVEARFAHFYRTTLASGGRQSFTSALRARAEFSNPYILEKIVESGIKTYYKEVCLLEQSYIHDSTKTVAQAVKEAANKLGVAVELKGFYRYALGEGIEKQETDFAAEVAAASGVKA